MSNDKQLSSKTKEEDEWDFNKHLDFLKKRNKWFWYNMGISLFAFLSIAIFETTYHHLNIQRLLAIIYSTTWFIQFCLLAFFPFYLEIALEKDWYIPKLEDFTKKPFFRLVDWVDEFIRSFFR